MGIYELLVTNEEIKALAHDRVSTWDIKQAALKAGMHTLRMDAWDKALAGATSVDEVLRVTKSDQAFAANRSEYCLNSLTSHERWMASGSKVASRQHPSVMLLGRSYRRQASPAGL